MYAKTEQPDCGRKMQTAYTSIRPRNSFESRSVLAFRLARSRMVVRFATGLHLLVLFVLFLEDGRLSEASLFRQVADVADDLPHLVVFDNSLPRRHAG